MRLRSLIILSAVALVLTACSGGDGSSDEAKPYVDAMVASLGGSEDGAMPEEDARCFSEKYIDVAGLDRVKKAGEPEDFATALDGADFAKEVELTRDEAEDIYDSLVDCGQDPMKQFQESLEGDDVPAEDKACMGDLVTEDLMREVMIAAMRGDEDNEKANEFSAGMIKCVMGDMDLEDLAELGEDVLDGTVDLDDLDLDSLEN